MDDSDTGSKGKVYAIRLTEDRFVLVEALYDRSPITLLQFVTDESDCTYIEAPSPNGSVVLYGKICMRKELLLNLKQRHPETIVLKLFKGGGDPGCDWFQEIYNIACGFKKIVELRAFFEVIIDINTHLSVDGVPSAEFIASVLKEIYSASHILEKHGVTEALGDVTNELAQKASQLSNMIRKMNPADRENLRAEFKNKLRRLMKKTEKRLFDAQDQKFLRERASEKCLNVHPKATFPFSCKNKQPLTHDEHTCADQVPKAHGTMAHGSATVVQQQQSKSLERQMDEVLQVLPRVDMSSELVRDEIRGLLGEIRRLLSSRPEDEVVHSSEPPSPLANRKRENGNKSTPTLEEASADSDDQQGALTETEKVKFA